MDWALQDTDFDREDLERVFEYEANPAPSLAICWFLRSGVPKCNKICLDRDAEWSHWIEEATTRNKTPGLAVILARRATEHEERLRNSSILGYLPFTRSTFEMIIGALPLHGDTARIINRSDVAFFTDIDLTKSSPGSSRARALFYCCRTSSTWAGDLAVSSVFYPDSGFTAALVFGCTREMTEEIMGRINNSEDAWTNPMLIMGILAEIERERHMRLVEGRLFHLLQRVRAISKSETISTTSKMHRENYSIDLWIEVSQVRMALETWKTQLAKMEAHIGELEEKYLTDVADDDNILGHSSDITISDESSLRLSDSKGDDDSIFEYGGSEKSIGFESNSWKRRARATGRRIQKRLREILCEYDQKIRECTMVIDGMALSTQLSWSQISYQDTQTNLHIATETKQESSQMRSIAVLTMVFLPATFMASLFSMTFFNWHPGDGENIVSPYLWIYLVLTTAVTVVVVGSWLIFTKRRRMLQAKINEKLEI